MGFHAAHNDFTAVSASRTFCGKRQRTGALQDAARLTSANKPPKVVDCGSPLPLVCLAISFIFGLMLYFPGLTHAQGRAVQPPTVFEIEGTVQILRAGSTVWLSAATNQTLLAGDRLRTGARSRAAVRISDATTKRLGELTIIEISDPAAKGGGVQILKGLIYFFHRDNPGTFPIRTPTAYAVVLGTEFNVQVADDGTTTFHIIDGTVLVTNALGQIQANSGQSVRSSPGQAPVRTAVLET